MRIATAGDIRLAVEVDRSVLLIDDRLRLSLRVEGPPGLIVEFPDLADRLGPFAVVGQQTGQPSTASDGRTAWERIYLLEPGDVGELTLPALAVAYRRGAGATAEQLGATPLTVTVRSVLPEGADLLKPRGIAPPVLLPPSRPSAGAWIIAGIVLAAIAALIWLAWRRYRRGSGRPRVRRHAAHLIALDRLDHLERADLIGNGHTTEFYTSLSDILRHYAAWRFGLSAPTQTTEEFLADIVGLGEPIEAQRGVIGALLAACDRVKFARHEPSGHASQRALRSAREFVERTGDPRVLVNDLGAGEQEGRDRDRH